MLTSRCSGEASGPDQLMQLFTCNQGEVLAEGELGGFLGIGSSTDNEAVGRAPLRH